MNDVSNKDYRRKILPPEFDTVKFICTRKFLKDQNGNLVNFKEDLEVLGQKFDLGNVIWLHMGGISAKNWRDLIKYCGEKGYVIFDVWGYIPGQKSSAQEWYLQDFGEFSPSDEDYQELLNTAGCDNFWGYDIGEQDSRYLGIFAPHYSPTTMDRKVQYQRFFNHFVKMRKDLKNDYSVLAGSTNVHYLAKEGGCRMIGGESLQIHPNINLWHAFIRGASKEYGIPFFGSVSVFNNFGYRMPYDARVDEFGLESGRTAGPSDSMLKNVFYTLYYYGSSLMGFEHFVTEKIGNTEELTVVGKIHKEVQALAKNKRPLKMVAPVAIYIDFFQGWQVPRNAVNLELFRVWGDLPYSPGDFQIAAIFELLYPNYCDSAVFKDERGFLVDTPYCDIAEVILSDAHEEILDNYRLIIIAGDLKIDREQIAKLNRFMDNGGKVICDNRSLALTHENLIRINTPYFIEASPGKEISYLNKLELSIKFPYILSREAEKILDRELKQIAPVRIENGSAMVVVSANETDKCRELLVINNSNTVQNLKLTPNGHKTIEVTVRPKELARFNYHLSANLDCKPISKRPKLKNDLAVALRDVSTNDWRNTLLKLPSFRNYFSGILIEGATLLKMSENTVRENAFFLENRGIEVVACDLTSLFNHYPDLSMLDTGSSTSAIALATVKKVVNFCRMLNCKNIFIPLQKNGEIAVDDIEALKRIEQFIKKSIKVCKNYDMQLHIPILPHRYGDSMIGMMQKLKDWKIEKNVFVYPDTGALLTSQKYSGSIKHGYTKDDYEIKNCFPKSYQYILDQKDIGGLESTIKNNQKCFKFLGISAPYCDFANRLINAHLPIRNSIFNDEIADGLKILNNKKLIVDLDLPILENWDDYFMEYQYIMGIL